MDVVWSVLVCATLSDMSRTLSIRLDQDLYDVLVEQAEVEGRTLSNYAVYLLKGGTRLMARDRGKRYTQAEIDAYLKQWAGGQP